MNGFPNVELVKFPVLDEVDQKLFDSSLERFFKKVGEDTKLHIALKQYKKGGLRVQHEVHCRAMVDGKSFFSSYEDWLFIEVIQKALDKLVKEIKKDSSKKV